MFANKVLVKRVVGVLGLLAILNSMWMAGSYMKILPKIDVSKIEMPAVNKESATIRVEDIAKISKINPNAPGCIIRDKDGEKMSFQADAEGHIQIKRGATLTAQCVID